MTDVREILAQLGLSEYADSFIAEGFDSWETLADITESDFNDLNVKLGHRRKIQRAIADWRVQFNRLPLPVNAVAAPSQFQAPLVATPPSEKLGKGRSEESIAQRRSPKQWAATSIPDGSHHSNTESVLGKDGSSDTLRTKRKYRRHPKPDKHAPQRPQSAYVIFSNHLRDQFKGQEVSFTDMAKIVGEKWQALDGESREAFDSQASAAKEEYYSQLAEYKKTDKHAQYQRYLQDFKEKYGDQTADEKRTKLKTEVSNSTQSSYESTDNPLFRPTSGTSIHSHSTPSETHLDTYSHAASPVTSHMNRNPSPFEDRETASSSRRGTLAARPISTRHSSGASSGEQQQTGDQLRIPYNASPPYQSHHTLPPPSSIYQQHQYPGGPASMARGPPSNLSQTSDRASSPNSPFGNIIDGPRSGRHLPPPLAPSFPALQSSPSIGSPPQHPVLEHRPSRIAQHPSKSSTPPSTSMSEDPRHSASLAALLRAGELAREADRPPSQPSTLEKR